MLRCTRRSRSFSNLLEGCVGLAGVLTVGERVLLALREVGLAIGAVEREVELPKANNANTTPTQRQHNANANANANSARAVQTSAQHQCSPPRALPRACKPSQSTERSWKTRTRTRANLQRSWEPVGTGGIKAGELERPTGDVIWEALAAKVARHSVLVHVNERVDAVLRQHVDGGDGGVEVGGVDWTGRAPGVDGIPENAEPHHVEAKGPQEHRVGGGEAGHPIGLALEPR